MGGRGTMRAGVAVLAAVGACAGAALASPVRASAADCALPGPADPTMSRALTVTGEFSTAQEGSFVYLPFHVPAGTAALRIRYCHDQPELLPPNPLANSPKHVLDLGLFEPSTPGGAPAIADLRGWAGSSIRDVAVAPNGFSSEAVYEANRKGYVSGRTTRGYQPGPIPAGEWTAEIGVAAVASQLEGDVDGKVAFKLAVELSNDAATWADEPYSPVAYNGAAADPDPGWYAGDFHVHGEQEPGNATVRETLEYAFAPYGGEGAGLDFVTLLDHNNTVVYGDIGRYQPDHPGKLIIRSTEVTTYRGHLQNHASGSTVDYRTGPLLEAVLAGTGTDRTLAGLLALRDSRPASAVLEEIQTAGGFTQINHPTIFPSVVPTFDDFCRGCAWDYSPAETDYSLVDAVEISTGPAGLHLEPNPGPNPFTPLAIEFWEQAIDAGGVSANHIAAVGSSDSHRAVRRSQLDPVANLTDAPIGMGTTVVFAPGLSEAGIAAGIRAGHSYVKPWGAGGPDLRLEARPAGESAPVAIIGDTLAADSADFTARVLNLNAARAERPGAYTLFVIRDGAPFLAEPIPATGDEFTFNFSSLGAPARYRLQVQRLTTGFASIEAVSSPIYLQAPGPGGDPGGGEPTPAEPGAGGPAAPPAAGGGSGADSAGCAGPLVGSKRGDRLVGTVEADGIRGRRGADRIRGRAGADCLFGGRGADRIRAGRGRDAVVGGAGRDRIRAADGRRDRIRCGKGRRDRVRADARDRVRGCERVTREA